MEATFELPSFVQNITPGVRTSDYSPVENWPGTWVIAQGNPTQLTRVQSVIEAWEVPVYIPRIIVRSHDGKRNRESLKPLFPGGYVFACVPYPELMPESPKRDWDCSSLIPISDQTRFRDEISAIQRSIIDNPRGRMLDGLHVGKMMEVVRGSKLIKGLKGPIERTPEGHRLWLNLSVLGAATPVEIDISDVEPLN